MIRRFGNVEIADPGSSRASRVAAKYEEEWNAKPRESDEIVFVICYLLGGLVLAGLVKPILMLVALFGAKLLWVVVPVVLAILVAAGVATYLGLAYERHIRKGNILQVPSWIYDTWASALVEGLAGAGTGKPDPERMAQMRQWAPYAQREFDLLRGLLTIDAADLLRVLAGHESGAAEQQLRDDQLAELKNQIGAMARQQAEILRAEYNEALAFQSGQAEALDAAQAGYRAAVDRMLGRVLPPKPSDLHND